MKVARSFCEGIGWVIVILWILGAFNVLDTRISIKTHPDSDKALEETNG
jgi:hypothetical protein